MVSHLEFFHELPGYTRFMQRLARFARVAVFDKRGQGLSDRITGVPSLEERMDDLWAVMQATGARVMAEVSPGEVLVSRVLTNLVAGSALAFVARGSRALKGLDGDWDLFAVR